MASIKPLNPSPALLLANNDERYIVISDLHIGFEDRYKGIYIDSNYIYEMLDELRDLADKAKPRAFIILGDIKDSIASISKSEWRLIPEFLDKARRISDIIIIPGNHDNNISRLVPNNIQIVSSRGMQIDDTLLIHGHTSIRSLNVKKVVMGHLHPRFVKEGSVLDGSRVWIFLKMENGLDIVIMPTFNRYLSLNTRFENSVISFLNRDEIKECMVLTLDGSIIGNKDMLEYISI